MNCRFAQPIVSSPGIHDPHLISVFVSCMVEVVKHGSSYSSFSLPLMIGVYPEDSRKAGEVRNISLTILAYKGIFLLNNCLPLLILRSNDVETNNAYNNEKEHHKYIAIQAGIRIEGRLLAPISLLSITYYMSLLLLIFYFLVQARRSDFLPCR